MERIRRLAFTVLVSVLPSRWSTFGFIGILFGAASVIKFIRITISFPLSKWLSMLLETYENIVQFWLGWLDPYIRYFVAASLNWLMKSFGVYLHIYVYPHWKYMAIPIWLYFARAAAINYNKGRTSFAIFEIVWSSFGALITSIVAATIPAGEEDLLIVFIIITGLIVIESVNLIYAAKIYRWSNPKYVYPIDLAVTPWWKIWFGYMHRHTLSNFLLAIVVLLLGLALKKNGIAIPAAFLILLYLILMSLRNMMLGARDQLRHSRRTGDKFEEILSESGNWRHGRTVIAVLGAATAAIIWNAFSN